MPRMIVIAAAALALAGCASARDTNMAAGAAIGGVGGAVVAGPVGAVVGGAAGAVVADATRPHHRRARCYWSSSLEKRVCRY